MSKSKILLLLEEILNLLKKRESKLLNATETAQYLSISNSHLYKLTSQRKIPFHKPTGKYLYFYKHELDEWIRRNDEQVLTVEDCRLRNEELSPDNQMDMFDETEEEEETEPP